MTTVKGTIVIGTGGIHGVDDLPHCSLYDVHIHLEVYGADTNQRGRRQ